ncbi:subtilisin-like protein [Tothia fuscella]|uniref:Subtilisin-like protein n=1 Tax=Tothia fuscella TaxID=1048955 RepID=A0A9P4TXL1_9PEZI|nr:subtilisin-like protein [Tothia fuscella]
MIIMLRTSSCLTMKSSSLFVWCLPTLFTTAVYSLPSFHEAKDLNVAKSWYIVSLHSHYQLDSHLEHISRNTSVDVSTISPISAINGYHARLSDEVLYDIVQRDPGVKYIQQDYYLDHDSHALATIDSPDVISRIFRRWKKHTVDPSAWFVRKLTYWGTISPIPVKDGPSEYLEDSWKGVHVYILDSGIRRSHVMLNHQAVNFKGKQDTDTSPYVNEPMEDTHGHGTAVAGVVIRIAPAATLMNVKVRGTNRLGDLAGAISDVTDEHISYRNSKKPDWRGSVINISIETGITRVLTDVIKSAIKEGIPVVSSAGNANADAVTGPCGIAGVICVAACNSSYKKWAKSNYGKDVTIVAPGEKILSATSISDTKT